MGGNTFCIGQIVINTPGIQIFFRHFLLFRDDILQPELDFPKFDNCLHIERIYLCLLEDSPEGLLIFSGSLELYLLRIDHDIVKRVGIVSFGLVSEIIAIIGDEGVGSDEFVAHNTDFCRIEIV